MYFSASVRVDTSRAFPESSPDCTTTSANAGQNDWPRLRHPGGVCVAFVGGCGEAIEVKKFCNNTAGW